MFQVALGRLGSPIQALPTSLPLHVYVDAGGRASLNRVWGGLAAIGEVEDSWLAKAMLDLRSTNATLCLPTGELKGSALADTAIRSLARRIRDEDRRILFWANWYPAATHPRMVALAIRAIDSIQNLHADRNRLDAKRIDARYNRMATFLRRLKGINRHKVVSTLAHLGWLTQELKRVSLAPQLSSVRVVLDREDIPSLHDCGEFLKLFMAATLQFVGMSVRLTGRALHEEPDEGAITIDPGADSADNPGLQFVDILLQAVQRKLPGYGGKIRTVRNHN